MKARILAIHRYASLALIVLWVAQAPAGVVLVFRWELDDALLPGGAGGLRGDRTPDPRPGDQPPWLGRDSHLVESERLRAV